MLTEISKQRLSQCDQQLQTLAEWVDARLHINVSCGHRTKAEQDAEVAAGRSRAPFPTSKHNSLPSKAIDCYPVDGKQILWDKMDLMGALFKQASKELGVPIRWGGDFKTLIDKPHIELT